MLPLPAPAAGASSSPGNATVVLRGALVVELTRPVWPLHNLADVTIKTLCELNAREQPASVSARQCW